MTTLFKVFDKWAKPSLFIWVFLLTILFSIISIIRHNHFQSGGFDLGIYDQSVWQYAHFLYPYSTIKERFILGDHLALTLPFLTPIFYIYDDARALLVFQAFWLSFSAVAIYKIAKLRFSSFVSFALSFAYSLFYGIQFAVFSDFHPVIIGVGLLPWIAYFLETKKKKLMIVTVVLLLLTQENMGIALASLGFCYLFSKKFRKHAIVFISLGFVASFVCLKLVSFFSPIGYEYTPHIATNSMTVLLEFFNAQDKKLVWYYSLGSFGFLPIFSPGALLAVLLDLAQYFVTGPELSRMWSPFMHHRAMLAPFLAIGTIHSFSLLQTKKIDIRFISLILIAFTLFFQYYNHFPLNKLVKSEYLRTEQWMIDDEAIIKEVPTSTSVAAQQNLVAHLSHRREIYLAWPRQERTSACKKACWWLSFVGKPEYLAVDTRPDQWLTQILESNEHFQEAIHTMEIAKKITLIKRVNNAKLYKVNYDTKKSGS